MALGLAGPLSMMGCTGTADHDGSGDPVPIPDPFKAPGEPWLLLYTSKKVPGNPRQQAGVASCWGHPSH